jgi:predicted dehydrogenase
MATYRALLMGAGNMGRAWAQNLDEGVDVTLAGWVDVLPGVAAQAAAGLGLDVAYTGTDLDEALAQVRPDFVVDVTPPEVHHRVTLRALAAGLPVLGEKPMAGSMAQAREMVAAAERAGKLYMVSQNRRYDRNLQALRGLVRDQTGPLGILNSDFYIGAHFGGFREQMVSPLLLDMAIHTFDAARYVSGADPVAVYCDEFNPPWSWYRGNAAATAVFEMTGGLRYTYRGSWCGEGRATSWDAEWRAIGPHGTATWDGIGIPLAEVVTGQASVQGEVAIRQGAPPAGLAHGIAGSLRDFLHALDTGSAPMGECHDNLRSLAMVFAAIESGATPPRGAVAWEGCRPGANSRRWAVAPGRVLQ